MRPAAGGEAGKKPEPIYREAPRKPQPLPPPRKMPPAEKQGHRYGEIPAPRRANAPPPKQVGGANYRRQPWQKEKGKEKGDKGKDTGEE